MRAIALLSGGFDSPVAIKLMQPLLDEIIPLHFTAVPLTDDRSLKKSLKIAKKLGLNQLYVGNVAPFQVSLTNVAEEKWLTVLTRRFMLKVAEKLAEEEDATFLITGDSLGQVASQTLENLKVIDLSTTKIVLRPLITFNKSQVIELSQEFGLYDLSKEVCLDCGLVPKKPILKAKLEEVLKIEKSLNIEELVSKEFSNLKKYDL